LKLSSSLCSSSVLDSEFQAVGPATEKALRPNALRLKRGTSISCLLADRRCLSDLCIPVAAWKDVVNSAPPLVGYYTTLAMHLKLTADVRFLMPTRLPRIHFQIIYVHSA